MVLPSDYLGPGATTHDLGRLTLALVADAFPAGNPARVQYKNLSEVDDTLGACTMQHAQIYEVTLERREITLHGPSTIYIDPNAIKTLEWNDFRSAFKHESYHHEKRRDPATRLIILIETRIERRNPDADSIERLMKIASSMHATEEITVHERELKHTDISPTYRSDSEMTRSEYFRNLRRIVASDPELFGDLTIDPFAPGDITEKLEDAYLKFTGEDPKEYTFVDGKKSLQFGRGRL